MEEKRSLINTYQKEVAKVQKILEQNLADLGKVVSPHIKPEEFPEKEILDQILGVEGEIKRIDRLIDDIHKADHAVKTSKEEISQIEQRLASIEFEKNSLYSRIGVIAYEEYTAGEASEEFSLVFSAVIHQNAKLTKVQKELKDIELRYVAASIFERVSLRMRQKKMRKEIDQLNEDREQLFRKAGKQICTSKMIKDIKSKTATSLAEEYTKLDKNQDLLNKRLEEKKSDKYRNEEMLSHAGVSENLDKRVEELNESKEVHDANIKQLYSKIGSYVLDHPDIYKDLKDDELKDILERIGEYRKRIEETEKKIKKLETELKISELMQIIDRDKQLVDNKRQQIEQIKREIVETERKIDQNNEKISEYKKITDE
ncbi:MAG: hypothetical protein K9K78_00565 [Spirochaetales bacterium]|nr:hypothetical protein [Spirochaetales bacterium]